MPVVHENWLSNRALPQLPYTLHLAQQDMGTVNVSLMAPGPVAKVVTTTSPDPEPQPQPQQPQQHVTVQDKVSSAWEDIESDRASLAPTLAVPPADLRQRQV